MNRKLLLQIEMLFLPIRMATHSISLSFTGHIFHYIMCCSFLEEKMAGILLSHFTIQYIILMIWVITIWKMNMTVMLRVMMRNILIPLKANMSPLCSIMHTVFRYVKKKEKGYICQDVCFSSTLLI